MTTRRDGYVAVSRDDAQRAIPDEWRPVLCEIVKAFSRGDYVLSRGIAGVEAVSAERARQIREYVQHYGATLVELPDQAWDTSVSQWYGTHWDLLVDLWTAEEGSSDLVLRCQVRDTEEGYRFKVRLVYVP